jgi:hypothetical protein
MCYNKGFVERIPLFLRGLDSIPEMPQALKSVLIVGSTGQFGSLFTKELASQRASFNRVAVHHDTSRPTDQRKKEILDEFKACGVGVVSADGYDVLGMCGGFDRVMAFLGNLALHLQPTIFRAAIRDGVHHFYPSEYGAHLLVGDNWTQRYYRYKVLTRQFLEERAETLPELGWTYFTVGRLTEWCVLGHFGVDNKAATAFIYGNGAGRQSLLSERDCAKYLVESLLDPIPNMQEPQGDTKGRRRTYRISGNTVTWEEIFRELGQVRGVHYNVDYCDIDGALDEEAAGRREGEIEKDLAASHKLIQGREGTLLPQPWDNNRFPHIQPKGVKEALRAALSDSFCRTRYGLA